MILGDILRNRWTYESELEFIANLGTFASTRMSRAKLLRGYLAGLKRRATGLTVSETARLHILVERELEAIEA